MRLQSWQLTAATAVGVVVTSLVAPTSGIALPKMYQTSNVEKLAEKIDKMQKHIDEFGTVVAKSPDVWGQSRLMQHRIEVEKELKDRLSKFTFGLNATEITRDSAFLASALALQGALNSTTKVTSGATDVTSVLISNPISAGSTPASPATTDANTVVRTAPPTAFGGQFASSVNANAARQISIEPTIELDQLKRYLDHLNQLRRNNEGDDTADSPGYSLNLVRIPVSVLPGKKTRQGYGAEITVTIKSHLSDELLPMAFKDLVINGLADRLSPTVMGIADRAPIFAVRKALQKYYESIGGVAPSSAISDNTDRFERSFSEALDEAITNEKSANSAKALYSKYLDVDKYLAETKPLREAKAAVKKQESAIAQLRNELAALEKKLQKQNVELTNKKIYAEQKYIYAKSKFPKEKADALNSMSFDTVVQHYQQTQVLPNELASDPNDSVAKANVSALENAVRDFASNQELVDNTTRELESKKEQEEQYQDTISNLQDKLKTAQDQLGARQDEAAKALESIHVSQVRLETGGGVQRRSKLAIPLTHHKGINGHTPYRLALDVFDNQAQSPEDVKLNHLDEMLPGRRGLDYQDVHSFIRSEAQGAYAFLAEPGAASLWNYCGPNLARAVREQRRRIVKEIRGPLVERGVSIREDIKNIRAEFFRDIEQNFPESKDSTTAALAWHIIVESSLLNEQLVTDMKEVAATKNCVCLSREWMQFYGPNPPPESRAAFNQYVDCRWPVHVFALDPVTQDQNLGESFSRRRELQLVLALAAANKRMGAQSLTRFVRRLEYDMETIELNRTEVGFSHGDDTFGWRFYPRVQAPQVGGNLQATGELLFGGPSREKDLLCRKLEPGIRECVAIVVMPSFVPYVTVDTRSNWFLLTNNSMQMKRAGHRELDLRNAVDESREIVELRELAQACFKDAARYRDGEVYRLQRAVDQLDRQLPLQTAYTQMPYENMLGGFEMFNTGVTDLAPELHGWYGAPGLIVGGPSSDSQTTSAAVARLWEVAAQAVSAHALAVAGGKTDATRLTALKATADAAVNAATAAQALAANAGLNPAGKTTIFLIGKNFSVLRNTVIAGGALIPSTEMNVISRQVMQVTIPWGLNTVDVRGRKYVDVHLATPYGATSHLHIPVANDLASQLNDAKAEIVDVAKKESLAATKKQTDDAVAAFAQQAIPKFTWAASKGQVAFIQYDTRNDVALFGLNGPGKPQIVADSESALPNVPGFRFTRAESAWFVEAEFEDGSKGYIKNGEKKVTLGPYAHEVKSGAIDLRSVDPEKEAKLFLDLAGVVKKNIVASQKLKTLRLYGFLRFRDQAPAVPDQGESIPSQDVLPVIKLEPLAIEVRAAAKLAKPPVKNASKTFPFAGQSS